LGGKRGRRFAKHASKSTTPLGKGSRRVGWLISKLSARGRRKRKEGREQKGGGESPEQGGGEGALPSEGNWQEDCTFSVPCLSKARRRVGEYWDSRRINNNNGGGERDMNRPPGISTSSRPEGSRQVIEFAEKDGLVHPNLETGERSE